MKDATNEISLESAKWFAGILRSLKNPVDRNALLSTKDFGEFEKICLENTILNSRGLWEARVDWQTQAAQGVKIPISPEQTKAKGPSAQGLGISGTVGAAAGIGLIFTGRNAEYNDFKKSSKKYAEEKAAEWEKRPDLARAKSKQEAYELAYREVHDKLAENATDNAQKWANKHKDQDLLQAIERKKLADERKRSASSKKSSSQQAMERYRKTRQRPPSMAGAGGATAWTPFPPNTLPGTSAPNTLGGVGKPNVLRGAQVPSAPARAPGILGRAKSLRSRGKRIFNDASSYLQRLFKKSFLGSIASAIGGFVSAVVTIAVNTIIAVGTFTLGAIAFILAKIAAGIGAILAVVNLPWIIVIAIILFLLVALFGILFGNPSTPGVPPEQSPYPGITFSKVCPTDPVPINGNATCQITFIYDSSAATCPLVDLTLIDDVPNGTSLVEGPGLTTGVYSCDTTPCSASSSLVRWRLSDNLTQPATDVVQVFSFTVTLRLTSPENITVTNRIGLVGCGNP